MNGFQIYVQCANNHESLLNSFQLHVEGDVDLFTHFLNPYVSQNFENFDIVHDYFAFDSLANPSHEAIHFVHDYFGHFNFDVITSSFNFIGHPNFKGF